MLSLLQSSVLQSLTRCEQEFLGDWVNLLSHQRAAHQIITDLFTPQTIMQSETHRKIISWYIRFDLFAGMMSGGKTVLGREWFSACTEFYKRQARDKPNDFGALFEDMFATSRLIATDIALLLASRNTGEKSEEVFAREVQELHTQMEDFNHTLTTRFTDPACFVKTFPKAPSTRGRNRTHRGLPRSELLPVRRAVLYELHSDRFLGHAAHVPAAAFYDAVDT